MFTQGFGKPDRPETTLMAGLRQIEAQALLALSAPDEPARRLALETVLVEVRRLIRELEIQ